MRCKRFLLIFTIGFIVSGCNLDQGNATSKVSTNYSMLFIIDEKFEEKNDKGKTIYLIKGHNPKDDEKRYQIKLNKNVWNLTKEKTVTYGISFDVIEGEKYGELLQIYRAPNPS